MTGYIWTVSSGGAITAGGGNQDNTMTVTWNTAGIQTVSVNYINTNNCIATAPAIRNVTVSNTPPAQIALNNLTVTSGQSLCWNASQTITVGGTGVFNVQNGGSATLMADQKIIMLPGVHVNQGGYLHAYITSQCQYCNASQKSFFALDGPDFTQDTYSGKVIIRPTFLVYPNPNRGEFTIAITNDGNAADVTVEIYSMQGERIMKEKFTGKKKFKLTLSTRPAGIYFLRVIMGNIAETVKIIKD